MYVKVVDAIRNFPILVGYIIIIIIIILILNPSLQFT